MDGILKRHCWVAPSLGDDNKYKPHHTAAHQVVVRAQGDDARGDNEGQRVGRGAGLPNVPVGHRTCLGPTDPLAGHQHSARGVKPLRCVGKDQIGVKKRWTVEGSCLC